MEKIRMMRKILTGVIKYLHVTAVILGLVFIYFVVRLNVTGEALMVSKNSFQWGLMDDEVATSDFQTHKKK